MENKYSNAHAMQPTLVTKYAENETFPLVSSEWILKELNLVQDEVMANRRQQTAVVRMNKDTLPPTWSRSVP